MSKYRTEMERLITRDFNHLQRNLLNIYQQIAREINRDLKVRMIGWENLSYSQRLETSRLQSLVLQIENQIDFLNRTQTPHMFRHLNSIAHKSYNSLFYEFEQLKGFEINFAVLPTEVIETIINTPVAGIRLSERLSDGLIPELKDRLHEVLVRGFSQGWSYQKMARNIREVSAMSYRRAMTIARTEGHRVTSITRQRSQVEAQSRGIKLKKKWFATLDKRTRDPHAELDGKVVGVDEYFEIDGMKALQPGMFGVAYMDINCRCRATSIIEGYEPDIRRDGLTKEEISYKNYREWERERIVQEGKREPGSRPTDRFTRVQEEVDIGGSVIPPRR